MKKIPTLFVRDEKTHKVTPVINNGLGWILDTDVIATQKHDGTCCMIINNHMLYKRYTTTINKIPNSFIPAQRIGDKLIGWIFCDFNDNNNKYHYEGLRNLIATEYGNDPYMSIQNGTYELIGEKINGNPENIEGHTLVLHGSNVLYDVPRTYEGLKEYLKDKTFEGIVFYKDYVNTLNQNMCKIKRKDFDYTLDII
jgi:hypothetical protein